MKKNEVEGALFSQYKNQNFILDTKDTLHFPFLKVWKSYLEQDIPNTILMKYDINKYELNVNQEQYSQCTLE
jgi:hypothetical protein